MNRNSERIPRPLCGGVSERIKNRLYSLRWRFPDRSAAGSFNHTHRAYIKAGCFAGVVALLITAWQGLFLYDELKTVYFNILVQSTVSDQAVLYYDSGQGFHEQESVRNNISGDGQFHAISFVLPRKPIREFRLDPLTRPGIVAIREVTITNASGKTVARIEPSHLQPLFQIWLVDASKDVAIFEAPAGAIDPQITVALTAPLNFSLWNTYPIFDFASKLIIKFTGFFFFFFLLAYLPSRFADTGKGILFVLLLVTVGWSAWLLYEEGQAAYLQIIMRSTSPGVATVYYDTGSGLSEEASSKVNIQETQRDKNYRFQLPNESIRKLRFDPLMGSGRISVSGLSIIDGYGNLYKRLELSSLRPVNQIVEFNLTDDQVTLVTSDKADDPQVDILLPTAIYLDKARLFPVSNFIINLIKNIAGIGLAGVMLFWGYRRYQGTVSGLLDNVFLRKQWPILCLVCALALILSMATISAFDVHPDELGHVLSARFYFQNWIPAAVDDPRTIESLSVFGTSYLFNLDIVYFFAAKMALLLQPLMINDYIGLRLFNVLLFAILVFLIARRIQSSQLALFALLATPQVWYIFSYFNNDAFPLFLSILIAIQCIDPMTTGYRFLHEPDFRGHYRGGVIIGALVGLLLLSKLNYRLFLVFLCCFACWQMTFVQPPLRRLLLLKKWLMIVFVACCIFLPRYAYDQYINHFQKMENITRIREIYAGDQFKPSTIEKSLSKSYPGLLLRVKGLTWQEMFLHNPEWRNLTFKSMLGLYGYMNLFSDTDYYAIMKGLFILLFIIILSCMVYGTGGYDAVLVSGAFCVVLLSLIVSVYHSWTSDYQPQGRYLFPVIAILMIGLSRLPTIFHRHIMPIFSTACFLMSFWSFLLYALSAIPKRY